MTIDVLAAEAAARARDKALDDADRPSRPPPRIPGPGRDAWG